MVMMVMMVMMVLMVMMVKTFMRRTDCTSSLMTTVQMTNAQGWHQHLALSIIVHHLDGYFGILTVSLFNMKNMVAIPFEDGVFVLIELQSFTILTAE